MRSSFSVHPADPKLSSASLQTRGRSTAFSSLSRFRPWQIRLGTLATEGSSSMRIGKQQPLSGPHNQRLLLTVQPHPASLGPTHADVDHVRLRLLHRLRNIKA